MLEAGSSGLRCQWGLVSPEAPLSGLWIVTPSLCPRVESPCMCIPAASSSSYQNTSSIGLGPTLSSI